MFNPLTGMKNFIAKQSRNYRILLVRQAGNSFIDGLTRQFGVLYESFLGANPTDIGFLSSLSSAFSAIISMPSGWLVDRYSLKKLLGISMYAASLSLIIYALATDWKLLIPAIIINSLLCGGSGVSSIWASGNLLTSVSQIYMVNSLRDEDRARGLAISLVLSSVGGLVMPILSAYLITQFGGFSAEGIRPLFYLSLVLSLPFTTLIFLKLDKENTPPVPRATPLSFLKDYRAVFTGEKYLKRLIVSVCTRKFVLAMSLPFTTLFMFEKQATPLIFGFSGVIRTLIVMLFSLPVGHLADSLGRKKTLFLLRPLMYIEALSLVLAPSPEWFLLYVALTGFPYEQITWDTFILEFVPPEKRGRWNGLLNFFISIVTVLAPVIGGLIYQYQPWLVFIIPIIADLIIRVPILISLPETLKKNR